MRPIFILSLVFLSTALRLTGGGYVYNQYYGGRQFYRAAPSRQVYRHAVQAPRYSNYQVFPAVNYHVVYKSPPVYYHPAPVVQKVKTIVYKPYVPPPPPPPPPPPKKSYGIRLYELAKMICGTFKDVGDIALEDDWDVGSRIAHTLKYETKRVVKIYEDYRRSQVSYAWQPTVTYGRRYKRQAASDPLNQMGDVLVDSNSKIMDDKKKLSAGAQKKINKKYKDGVKNCSADSCKAAAKILASVEDDSERQRRR